MLNTKPLLLALSLVALTSADVFAAPTKQEEQNVLAPRSIEQIEVLKSTERRNAVYGEFLGRGLVWSVNYDHAISDRVSLGIGFGYLSVGGSSSRFDDETFGSTSTSSSLITIPAFANIYFAQTANTEHRAFVSPGIVTAIASGTVDNSFLGEQSATGVIPVFALGLGYEYRGMGGFLFRANPYLGYAQGTLLLSGGISLGATF